jgi:LacI family transcriptional regulator
LNTKVGRRPRGGTTIQDVAREAGVSAMTVSRVINDEPNVRDKTRAAVNLAIRRLRYAPNPAARSLAGGDFLRIGLLYSNPSAAYLSQFLIGALDQAARSYAQIIIEKSDDDHEAAAASSRLVAHGIDGVILPPPLCEAPRLLKLLQDEKVRVVRVAGGDPSLAISSVRIDDFEAARLMTDHLLQLGHRRIGFITGDPKLTASALRLKGYRTALREAGAPASDDLVSEGRFTYRSGLDAADDLLSRTPAPTAIFAANDDMAAAALAAAHRRKLDVPADLTICGFDDSPIATTVWPELTTIRQPIAEMARRAVEILCAEIRASKAGLATTPRIEGLPVELIRRATDTSPTYK